MRYEGFECVHGSERWLVELANDGEGLGLDLGFGVLRRLTRKEDGRVWLIHRNSKVKKRI